MKQHQLYAQDTKKKINKDTVESTPSLPTLPIRGFPLWVDTIRSVIKSLLN